MDAGKFNTMAEQNEMVCNANLMLYVKTSLQCRRKQARDLFSAQYLRALLYLKIILCLNKRYAMKNFKGSIEVSVGHIICFMKIGKHETGVS